MNFINVKVDTEQEAMDVVNAMVLTTGKLACGRFNNSKERTNVVSLDYDIVLYSFLHEDFNLVFPYPTSASEYLNFIKENKDNPDYIQKMKDIHEFNNKIEKENNMKVPYVKVNNQKEFERVVAKMERETGLPNIHKYDTYYPIISANEKKTNLCGWVSGIDDKIISADEYLTGTRENFTLDGLEDGMVIEYRNGEKRLFMYDSFIGIDSYGDIENYNENFSHNQEHFELDVVKIYKLYSFKGGFDGLFDEKNLTLIFDAEVHRNKSKISQRKLEIENEINRLEEELKSLEAK